MTWVSLRSGMASSGSVIMDRQPHRQAKATPTSKRVLCLTEISMMRLIMADAAADSGKIMLWVASEILLAALRTEVIGSAITMERVSSGDGLGGIDHHAAGWIFNLAGLDGQPRLAARWWCDLLLRLLLWRRLSAGSQSALRIHKERSCGDHALAFIQAPHDLDTVRKPPPGFDLAGFKHPLATLYEHALLASRVNQCIQGHGESRRHSHRQFHVDKHVRTQGKSGVVRFEPQLQSPGNGIDLRKGVTHACRKGFSLTG